MGGRGAGKTRAGAEWVRAIAEQPVRDVGAKAPRIALVGETIDQVREVMVFGDSGLLAVSPPDQRICVAAWVCAAMLCDDNAAQCAGVQGSAGPR